jgi:predicted transglutaminase-like cysteine proteinase
MNTDKRGRRPFAAAILMAAATLAGAGTAIAATDDAPLYVAVSEVARAPIGWVEFCASNPGECATIPSAPRDVVMTSKAFKDLVSVNRYVNETIKPLTDLEHWGTIEKWSYPDDGHAVLTVKTDRGEYILDNQAEDVVQWFETGYRFVKRQSQKDPNVWVSLGDPRPAPTTVARQHR